MNKFLNKGKTLFAVAVALAVGASPALAEPAGDYDALVEAVDFTAVVGAVTAVAAAVVVVLIAIRAVRFIMGIIRR